MKAPTKIVTFRFSPLPPPPFPVLVHVVVFFFFFYRPPSQFLLLLLHPDVHGENIHRRRCRPFRRDGTRNVGQRHNRPTTSNQQQRGVIAPFDELGLSTGIRIRSTIHRLRCASRCCFPVDRDSYSPQPRRTTCQARRVICIKMESNTVRGRVWRSMRAISRIF